MTSRTLATEQPDSIAPATPPYTYFGVAENMPAVKLLAADLQLRWLCAGVRSYPECLLKAFLAKAGVSDAALKDQKIRHDLNALWALAVSQGLRVQATPPAWADCLSGIHGPPFYLRYSTDVHAIRSPAAEPMASELKDLLELVREQLR